MWGSMAVVLTIVHSNPVSELLFSVDPVVTVHPYLVSVVLCVCVCGFQFNIKFLNFIILYTVDYCVIILVRNKHALIKNNLLLKSAEVLLVHIFLQD